MDTWQTVLRIYITQRQVLEHTKTDYNVFYQQL